VNEKDLPKGKKLLRCSKCKETFYKDRESQLMHWPIHKLVCCSIGNDDPRIRAHRGPSSLDSVYACMQTMAWILEKPKQRIKGRLFLYALQQFRALLKTRDMPLANSSELRELLSIHILVPICNHEEVEQETIDLIMAIPGFANYMLNDEILLSEKMREYKEKDIPPPPPEVFARDGTIDPKTEYDPKIQLAFPYCEFVLRFFSSVAGNYAEDEISPYLKKNPLSAAIIRTVMACWMCPYTRVSFKSTPSGDPATRHWVPRNECFYMLFRAPHHPGDKPFREEYIKESELTPGLTVKQMLKILMDDESLFFTLRKDMAAGLLWSLTYHNGDMAKQTGPWKFLTPKDRIELLDHFQDWRPRAPRVICQKPENESMCDLEDFIVILLTGSTTQTLFKLYDALKEVDNAHKRTIMMIEENRKELLQDINPSVKAYFDIAEKKYQDAMAASGSHAQPFPEELLETIGEFALPSSYEFSIYEVDNVKPDDASKKEFKRAVPESLAEEATAESPKEDDNPYQAFATTSAPKSSSSTTSS
jgi:hypothetical protein